MRPKQLQNSTVAPLGYDVVAGSNYTFSCFSILVKLSSEHVIKAQSDCLALIEY